MADRPLRIVLSIGSLQVGGTESQLVKLAGRLRARGHDVHVLAVSRGGPYEDELRAMGVPTRVAEVVHDGVTGLLLDDPRRREMGCRARAWATQRFGAERFVADITGIYRSISEERG